MHASASHTNIVQVDGIPGGRLGNTFNSLNFQPAIIPDIPPDEACNSLRNIQLRSVYESGKTVVRYFDFDPFTVFFQ